ncbi:MAG: cytidylyltransferase domain-containing protein [Dethiobacteria bacterium]|jgi:spore coat polysaccharide biosynthesis protein SpsF
MPDKNKVGAIIQARTGSSRLPGKVLKILAGKTVLEHVIERIRQSKVIGDIIIATTEHEKDNSIDAIATKVGVSCFRGSEDDVLSRYYYAAKEHAVKTVIRITSDCPLIDPKLCDEVISFYLQHHGQYVLVTNAGPGTKERTYPRGLDLEVFSYNVLEEAFHGATRNYQREHVTPWIYERYKDNIHYYKNDVDYSNYRWTLDTVEDYSLIREIYGNLYRGEHNFYFADILRLFQENPGLSLVNGHVIQKTYNGIPLNTDI